MVGTNKTDSELIASFLGEDAERSRNAFGLLYQKYQRTLLDKLYRKIGKEEEVKDCSQKIWLKLVEKLRHHTVSPDAQGSIGGLLMKMANDEAADYFRRESHIQPEVLFRLTPEGELAEKEWADVLTVSADRVFMRDLVSLINKALEHFVQKDRKIFWSISCGETPKEVSRRMGYTEATVKKKFTIQKLHIRHFLSMNGYGERLA